MEHQAVQSSYQDLRHLAFARRQDPVFALDPKELAALVPESQYYNFHINLIEHGRAVCRARKPACGACVVSRHCDHFARAPKAQP